MKTKISLFISVFLLNVFELYSRAGGGGYRGGGGGYSGGGYRSYGYGYHSYHYGSAQEHYSPFVVFLLSVLPFLLTGLAFFGFTFMAIRSHKNAKKKLEKAQRFDSFWNEERMQNHVREVFPEIQSAWMSRELRNVSHLVTLRFVGRFQPLLNEYKRKKIINVLDRVQVETVRIVDVHDDKDNSKDCFAAYIKGTMRDFISRESGGILGTIHDQEPEGFEDLYIFKRKGDKWMLDHIINDPGTGDFKLRQYLG